MSAVFDAYAAYYDLFNSDKDYAAEAAYVAQIVRRHAPGASRLLDLGCGTGRHATHLVSNGFSVTGVDLSPRMLAEAERRKADLPEEAAKRLSFRNGDARTLAFEERFDAVLALFHVMSYQITDADVAALIDAAARHLEPGGAFLFDFWHGPAVLSQGPEVRIKRRSAGGVTAERLAEPELLLAENRVAVNYTIRVDSDPAARPAQFSERHDMRYFFLPELRRFAGEFFEMVGTYAWMSDREPGIDDWSAVATLRRR
jgi:SAM-dependent methyltransferase